MKNLTEKIEELNEFADNSLSITRYIDFWELTSYREKSPFSVYTDPTKKGKIGKLTAKTFESLIDNAYNIMLSLKNLSY